MDFESLPADSERKKESDSNNILNSQFKQNTYALNNPRQWCQVGNLLCIQYNNSESCNVSLFLFEKLFSCI